MFAPLRMRTYYSLRSGASSMDALLEKAQASGIRAMAITDENNLYGAATFFRKMQQRDMHPILGAIIDEPSEAGGRDVVLLARDETGYSNLCEIVSMRRLYNDFVLSDAVCAHHEGLAVLVRDIELLESLAERIDLSQLYAELIRPTDDIAEERRFLTTARRLGARPVAQINTYFADPDDLEAHQALSAMRLNCLLTEAVERTASHAPGFLRTPSEMQKLFEDIPEALSETERLAESCSFDLLARKPVFPALPGDSIQQLRHDTTEHAKRKYGKVSTRVSERLEREFDLIGRLGFADYFLVVADIVRHARGLGTPVAGRGSGASSLVAYCLGITNVDPLRFSLPFERFLNEGRKDFPDLDIDFCWRLRDDVIDYVYKKYGDGRPSNAGNATEGVDLSRLHVAMIATYATLQPALAFREASKVVGIPDPSITEIAGHLRHGLPRERWNTLPADPRAIELAITIARKLDGFPHHLSLHCGGVVITPEPIARHAPLQRAEKGVVITQYDKDGVEDTGLVKLDLLGNRALSSTSESVRLVAESGSGMIDPEALPERDLLTQKLLSSGNTIGVNQLESPAMRHLLRQLRASDVEDLMQILALIRPGAASLGMKEAFVKRARGIKPVPPIDPRLDDILLKTHGIMLYEDDALFIAAALAGLDPADADKFRRAVTKCRSDIERLRLSEEFLGRARKNGADPAVAADMWVQMAKFNSYSFCRAHAASYARLAWANAYMKAHYPAQFWVAALNNNQSMYEIWVYMEEAKRMGVKVLLPCVNRSGMEFMLCDGAVRAGLGRVKELTEETRNSIMSERPFEGLTDLIARTEVRLAEAENLVRVGALDFCNRPRPELLLELYSSFESAKRLRGSRCAQSSTLFRMEDDSSHAVPVGKYSESRKWRDEWDIAGFATGYHPMAWLRRMLMQMNVARSREIPNRAGQHIRLCGVAAAARTTRTSQGGKMCFVTLSDEDGLFEATLFPETYRRHSGILADSGFGPYLVEGHVESQYDAISITASRIESFDRYRRKSRRRA